MLQFEIGSRPLPNAHLRKVAMPRPWRMSCFVAGLIAVAAVSGSDAKVLRTKGPASTVWVFKNADELWRFEKVARASVYDESKIEPLLACKVPQGTKIVVLASGYRTAYIRVAEGSAQGCEGAVPLARVKEE